jgi:hypothetical protein
MCPLHNSHHRHPLRTPRLLKKHPR